MPARPARPALALAAAPAPSTSTEPAAEDPTLPGDLDAILSELGTAAAVVSLWRVTGTGRPAYLGRIPAGEFSLDGVRAEHGGGTYQARVIGPDERIRRQTTFAIDGAPRAPGPAAAAAESSRLDRLEAALTALLERTAAPPARAERDPVDLALKLAEVMRPGAAAPAPAAGGLALADVLALVDRTRTDAIQLGKELAGVGPERGEDMAGVLGQMMPPLIALAKRDVSAREQRNALAARLVRPNPPAPDAGADALRTSRGLPVAPSVDGPNAATVQDMARAEEAVPAVPAWLARVKPFAGYLAGWAQKQCDPETYAVFILDNMDDESLATVEAEAPAPDFAARTGAQLAALSPKLAPYGAWLTRLCAAIQQQVNAPADDEAPNDAGAA